MKRGQIEGVFGGSIRGSTFTREKRGKFRRVLLLPYLHGPKRTQSKEKEALIRNGGLPILLRFGGEKKVGFPKVARVGVTSDERKAKHYGSVHHRRKEGRSSYRERGEESARGIRGKR